MFTWEGATIKDMILKESSPRSLSLSFSVYDISTFLKQMLCKRWVDAFVVYPFIFFSF
jgi:hypothetical protein